MESLTAKSESSIYYDRGSDTGKWQRLLKFPLDEGNYSHFSGDNLCFKISYNRIIEVTDGSKTQKLELPQAKQSIIFDLLRNNDNLGRYKIKLYLVESKVLYIRIYVSLAYIEDLCGGYQMAPRLIDTLIRNSYKDGGGVFEYLTEKIEVHKNIAITDKECPYMDMLKITPFTHQKNNVMWMDTVERNVDFGLHSVEYAITQDLIRFSYGGLCLYLDPESSILYNEESLWRYKDRLRTEYFKGGVLCDQVGLGKTLSMTCLILANPQKKSKTALKYNKKTVTIINKQSTPTPTPTPTEQAQVPTPTPAPAPAPQKIVATIKPKVSIVIKPRDVPIETPIRVEKTVSSESTTLTTGTDKSSPSIVPTFNADIVAKLHTIPTGMVVSKATLIYCPRRLVGQWLSEIEKYTNAKARLKVIELSTMVHINKYSMADLQDIDVVVVSFSLLTNKKYREQNDVDLTKIYWHRVIVDEGHEVLVHDIKKVDDVRTNTEIMNTKGRYKWICTGTPLPDGYDSMQGIISFLTDKNLGETSNMLKNMTDDEYKKYVSMVFHRNTEESSKGEIFIPKVIESTDFLEFTKTERAIYNNAVQAGDTVQMMQLCTNILISDGASAVFGNKALPLDQVNSAMSTYFKDKVDSLKNAVIVAENETKQTEGKQAVEIPELEQKVKDLEKIISQYTMALVKKTVLPHSAAEQEGYKEDLENAKKELTNRKASFRNKLKTLAERIEGYQKDMKYNQRQVALYTSLNATQLMTQKCPITGCGFKDIVITPSGQCYSREGIEMLFRDKKTIYCPFTRETLEKADLLVIQDPSKTSDTDIVDAERNKWGTKMAHLVKSLKETFEENHEHRVIIFSQWKKMLDMIADVLRESRIEFVFCRGNVHMMSKSIQRFKTDNKIKVILLSSENCSSGSNLTEATHIFLMDTVNASAESAKAIEEQAIARAVRLGQKYNVRVKRFIMKDTIEEEYYKRNALVT